MTHEVDVIIQHSTFNIYHSFCREDPIKYLCLVYYDETSLDALPERMREDLVSEILAYREDLQAGGRCLASEAVQPVEAASTVRMRRGKASITAGALHDEREQLCEFYLIDARDLNDVLRVVLQMPPARLGAVEVWPVRAEP